MWCRAGMNVKFNRSQIDVIDTRIGDQSDGANTGNAANAMSSPSAAADNRDSSGEFSDDDEFLGSPQVYVIALHGTVGGFGENSIRQSFDAAVLNQCLYEADNADAA